MFTIFYNIALMKCGELMEKIKNEIKNMMKNKKYSDALGLCTEELCCQDNEVQQQKIIILLGLERYEEAVRECDLGYQRWQYKKYLKLKGLTISYIIKNYIQNKEYDAALGLCTDELCLQFEIVNKKKIDIIFYLLERYEDAIRESEKAYQRWQKPKFLKAKHRAISLTIKKLVENKEYERALELCSDEVCKQNEVINSQKICILNKLERMEREKVKLLEIQEDNSFKKEESNNKISLYLTKIYFNDINLLELDDITSLWAKIILQIAYYEKFNKGLGLKLINEVKKDNNLTLEQKKVLNKLLDRLRNKKPSIFDVSIYSEILKVNIDFDYVKVEEVILEEVKEEKKVIVIEPKEKVKNKINSAQYKVCVGTPVNRYNNQKNKTVLKQVKVKEVLIGDVFKTDIDVIKKYVYYQIHFGENKKSAIKVWDIIEDLKNEPISNTFAQEKMIRMINICIKSNAMKLDSRVRTLVKNN